MKDKLQQIYTKVIETTISDKNQELNCFDTQCAELFALLLIEECCEVLYKNNLGGRRVDNVLKKYFEI